MTSDPNQELTFGSRLKMQVFLSAENNILVEMQVSRPELGLKRDFLGCFLLPC